MSKVFNLPSKNGVKFTVEKASNPGIDDVGERTILCFTLLIIYANDGLMRWGDFFANGFGVGDLMTMGHKALPELLPVFLPNQSYETMGWNFETSSSIVAAHTYMAIGHKGLFGEKGIVRNGQYSLLRPDIIAKESIEAN